MSTPTLFQKLEGLWIQAGGSSSLAPLMAGIGLNEGAVSDPYGINPDSGGSQSAGIWQINSANWPGLIKYGVISGANDLTDPLTNAKAAVYLAGARGQNIMDTWRSTYAKGLATAEQYLGASPVPNPYPTIIASTPSPSSQGGSTQPSGNYLQSFWQWLKSQIGAGTANIDPNTGQPRPGTPGIIGGGFTVPIQIQTWQWLIVAGGLLIIGLAIVVANHQEEIITLAKTTGEGAAEAAA